jgi:hypothetical protein
MALAQSIDACIAFAGGILAAYYGWRPVPAGPKQLEWMAWKERWGMPCRIAGLLLIVTSVIQMPAKAS